MRVSMHLFLLCVASSLAAPAQSPLTALPIGLVQDDSFDFQILIGLGNSRYGAGTPGELLAAAKVLQPGNFSNWNQTFYDLAAYTEKVANSAKTPAEKLNNRDTWFSASAYWRLADFYNHQNWSLPIITTYWQHWIDDFNKANALLDVPGVRVTIPADGFDVVGIFYGQANNSTTPLPTLIVGQGYDAAQEDSYHQTAIAALDRGWNVMLYEGPGQPTVRREQNIGFIVDWERAVTPVVDYLYNRTDVDTSKICLVGISMGGYLAARAAAFEKRLAALILDGGIYEVFSSYTQGFGPLLKYYEAGNQTAFDYLTNKYVTFNNSASSQARWGVQQGLWAYNTHSPFEWLQRSQQMTLAGGLAENITVPTFISNAVNDASFPGEAPKLKAHMGSNAHMYNFTGPLSYHSSAGSFDAANQVMFDWLDGVFAQVK